jgi:beta-galactosidase/beta-glucuronidase
MELSGRFLRWVLFTSGLVLAGGFDRLAISVAFGEDLRARRTSMVIAAGWCFQLDTHDQGERELWFADEYDRSAWRSVEVPRAWDTYDESLRGYEGIAWYAVSFNVSPAARQGISNLTFGRVMYHSRVWLNGEFLGEHIDGYLPFSFDVTHQLRDSENHLVLRVDNRPRIDWMPAAKEIEWVQYGGILQPVRLETRPELSITNLAVHGVPQGAGAKIECVVDLEAPTEATDVRLKFEVEGVSHPPAFLDLTLRAGGAAQRRIRLSTEEIVPWSPETPTLYTLVVTLEKAGHAVDQVRTPFGVRSIATHGRRLLLNGKPLLIRGVNRYDEFGLFGPNPPLQLVETELRLMKQAGVNLIRTHYPQAPEFLTLCDRLGLLLLEELPINWWGMDWFGKEGVVQNESILEQALPMLRRMIHRDRNHPCVIIWSMANESKTDNEVGIRVMRSLIRKARELDPTRLVTFVTAPGTIQEHRAYEEADLVAFNLYPGSLGPPLAHHTDQLEERARKPAAAMILEHLSAFPGKPMLVTEFGAMGFPGQHGQVPATEEFQAAYLETLWQAISGIEELSGGVVWSWADYHHRRQFRALGAFGAFGLVTIDRRPKLALRTMSRLFGGEIRE